jgi:hypothetical protein
MTLNRPLINAFSRLDEAARAKELLDANQQLGAAQDRISQLSLAAAVQLLRDLRSDIAGVLVRTEADTYDEENDRVSVAAFILPNGQETPAYSVSYEIDCKLAAAFNGTGSAAFNRVDGRGDPMGETQFYRLYFVDVDGVEPQDPNALKWGRANSDNHEDYTADSRIVPAGCTSSYYALSYRADVSMWEVEFIATDSGEDVPDAGFHLGLHESRRAAQDAARKYEDAARFEELNTAAVYLPMSGADTAPTVIIAGCKVQACVDSRGTLRINVDTSDISELLPLLAGEVPPVWVCINDSVVWTADGTPTDA